MNPINKRLPRLTHSNSLRSLSTNYSKNECFEFPLKRALNNKSNTFILNKTNLSSSLPKISNKYDPIKNNKHLNKIYNENFQWFEKFNKIKKKNFLALKNNFNVEDYQKKLLNIFISNNAKIENNNIFYQLKKNFSKIQNILEEDKNYIHKNNRWKDAAEKLQYLLPQHLISKLKNLSM